MKRPDTRSILQTCGLYFVPGLLFTFVLYAGARPISAAFGWNLWLTQVWMAVVFLLGFEGILAWKLVRPAEGNQAAHKRKALGLVRPSWKELGIALLFSIVGLVILKIYKTHVGMGLMTTLNEFPLLALPDWHYQVTQPPAMGTGSQVMLMLVVLGANVFCEELFFRGYLFPKTEEFAGRHTWLVNGTLFIAYHIFQAAKTYALLPLGLLIAGYYAWRRNLYGVMLVHLLFNMFL